MPWERERERVRKVLLNKIFTTWNAKPCLPQTKMLYQGPRVQSNRDLGFRASDINTVQLDFSHFGLAWRGAWPSNVPETINCIHVQPVLMDGGIVSVDYAREPIDYYAAWYRGWQGFRWFASIGVRGRSKWTKSGLYESIGLVRRWKQRRVTSFLWYLIPIHCVISQFSSLLRGSVELYNANL